MKYNPPFGSSDPNAAYRDRNTPGAIAGSRVPAAAVEHPQREIMAVIAAAGIEASEEDLTQLLQAIQNLIAAATGGEGDENYVLMTQARARIPIFPETLTSDGKLEVISPSTGMVRVMPGYNFLHRGIFNVTTIQQDFATAASKTYHLRWNPTSGFVLKDLADIAYNAGGLPEISPVFDSTYDDMIVARVITNGSNVATITKLSNKQSLTATGEAALTGLPFEDSVPPSGITQYQQVDLDWARIPFVAIQGVTDSPLGYEWNFGAKPLSRYKVAVYSQAAAAGMGEFVSWQAWR